MHASSGTRAASAALLLSLFVAACGPFRCSEVGRPIETAARLQLRQIYDAREWLRRVPVEFAVSLYARQRLAAFVDEFELAPDVRRRLHQRLDARDFVDELVPFLLFVREMYQPADGERVATFDEHLRKRFAVSDGIPGMEHRRFRFAAAERSEAAAGSQTADGGGGVSALDPAIAARLLSFYDALYLRERPGAAAVGERLACESRGRSERAAHEAATRAAAPSVRGLLEVLEKSLEPGSDFASALRGVLADDGQLTAATSALVRFVDSLVCRHYRYFAARAFRAQQLEAWMEGELSAPDGGALWEFLEHAQNERRHGVVVVVDGLQGRLMRALASGRADDPFVQAIAREQAQAGGAPPRARSLREAPAQQTRFLEALAARDFAHPHYLPFFRERLADARTHWLPVGISTTPTISVRNIPIALTGAPVAGPGATGLPNFHFVERSEGRRGPDREAQGRAYYFYGSDAVELTELAREAGMRTLFDRLPQLGSLSCSAQYDEAAHAGVDALLNLGLGEKLRDFGERLCALELERRSATELELRVLRERLLALRRQGPRAAWWRRWTRFGERQAEALAHSLISDIARLEQRTLPELLVVYNPWPDHFAHFDGPFADEILAPSGELNRLDYWLGQVQGAYARAAALERSVFGLAGDHGLSPVFHLVNTEVEIFDALREEGVDLRVVKISSDEGEGPKLTNPFDPPPMKGIDVVLASTAGGNTMLDLFVDQGANFARQPLASELRAVRPLAQPEARPIDLLDEIARRLADSLDYLVVREEACGPEGGAVRLIGHRGGALAQALIRRRGDRIHLELQGADLLDTDRVSPYERHSAQARAEHAALRERCLAAPVARPEDWCTSAEWRRLTSFTPRPDSVVQLAHLYDGDRAGSVNLFPRAGVGYNTVVPGRHAGESFHEKNAFVALWGGALSERAGAATPRSAVNGAIPMAIYEHLSGERPVRGEDGWGYAPLPAEWFSAE